VRTTSGHYAHYHNGEPLFPSDWVVYNSASQNSRLGRVIAVGLDFQDSTSLSQRGKLMIKLQHAYRYSEIPLCFHSHHYSERNEVILLSEFSFVEETAI